MFDPKGAAMVAETEVQAKKDAAVKWCRQAADHAQTCGGKQWKYVLVPHDVIAENMTLEGLAGKYVDK